MEEERMKRYLPINTLKKLAWIVACMGCLAPEIAHAYLNGSRAMSYGARSLGRGGVDIAVADDTTGINTNPAGMAWVEGGMADVNLSFLFPDIEMKSTANPDGSRDKDRFVMGPAAGLINHPAGSPWAFGFSVAAPDALATDYTLSANYLNSDPTRAGTASVQSAFSEWIHLRFSPAVAYKVNDRLSLGARLGIDYMTLDLRAPLGRSYLNMGTADGLGYSVGLGVQYRPIDALRLGFSVESQAYMQDLTSRRGDASLKLDVSGVGPYPTGTILAFNSMKTEVSDWESPPVVGAGIAYQINDKLSVGADFKYYFWSETNNEMKITFKGGDVDALKAASGVDSLTMPARWEDSWAMGIGGNYRMMDWMIARLGYNFGNSVTESNYTNYLTPIIFNQHMTVGSTMIFNKFELTMAVIYSFDQKETNNTVSGIDSAITTQLGGLPIDSELNSMKVDGTLTTLSLQMTTRF